LEKNTREGARANAKEIIVRAAQISEINFGVAVVTT
jgi:hypothetical protein